MTIKDFSKKVRPCPCGSTFENKGLTLRYHNCADRQIECENCGRRGMISDDKELLISSWNFDYLPHDL